MVHTYVSMVHTHVLTHVIYWRLQNLCTKKVFLIRHYQIAYNNLVASNNSLSIELGLSFFALIALFWGTDQWEYNDIMAIQLLVQSAPFKAVVCYTIAMCSPHIISYNGIPLAGLASMSGACMYAFVRKLMSL